jgi:hypothetical protein
LISSITQKIPLAVPYPANGVVVPANKDYQRFQIDSDDGIGLGKQTTARVAIVKNVSFAADDQHHQQEQRINRQFFTDENKTSAPASMSTAQVLGELINRMGGTGIYSGPGQLVNIAV